MPDVGRWMTPDPLLNDLKFTFDDSQIDDEDEVFEALITKLETGDGIFNVDNLNPYGYGYNNPVSFDDPDGRCPVCIIVAAALLYSEFSHAPTTDKKRDSRDYNSNKGNRTVVSEAIITRGGSTGLPAMGSKKSNAVNKNTNKKSETLDKNKTKAREFEKKTGEQLKKDGHENIQEQVTIQPNGMKGKVRLDNVSKKDGKTVLTESKSSKTAPLTKNQKSGFPAIEKNGGRVVGKGKPGYPGGTQIPPTKVNIKRPE